MNLLATMGPKAALWGAVGIAGPTASGKSALALAAAQHWPVELISVDSAQVFRGLDIGTAKPSAAERAAVVACLRAGASNHRGFGVRFIGDELAAYADAIERGEHRRKEER